MATQDDLFRSIQTGDLARVQAILTDHADWATTQNDDDDEGKTPLHCASDAGQLAIARYLLQDCGASCDVTDRNGNTPLHYATDEGLLNLLVQHAKGEGGGG
eukprot:CAMPEP_0168758440 /NCGR_PEP_ID=MMETSP0724-20121128/21700_1 /TAXON_ID=265536 /ORGANISM="Amphiprora sp., Strain CCMP467" /LENGTH=101 /DNA_ID=CAMNT_0008807315 /DNA_START=338 /DNA_END=640 /DNA_ORIENTATION=+